METFFGPRVLLCSPGWPGAPASASQPPESKVPATCLPPHLAGALVLKSNSLSKKMLNLFFLMCICVCVWVCTPDCRYTRHPLEGDRLSVAGVLDACRLPTMGSLHEQCLYFPAGPPFQLLEFNDIKLHDSSCFSFGPSSWPLLTQPVYRRSCIRTIELLTLTLLLVNCS